MNRYMKKYIVLIVLSVALLLVDVWVGAIIWTNNHWIWENDGYCLAMIVTQLMIFLAAIIGVVGGFVGIAEVGYDQTHL